MILYILTKIYIEVNDYKEAILCINDALPIFLELMKKERNTNILYAAKLLLIKSAIYSSESNGELAVTYAGDALKLLNECDQNNPNVANDVMVAFNILATWQ